MATRPGLLAELWRLSAPVCTLAMLGGGYSAVLGWHPGAYIAIGGMVCLIASHSLLGVIAYRRVMSRPWPKVAPLSDDDD